MRSGDLFVIANMWIIAFALKASKLEVIWMLVMAVVWLGLALLIDWLDSRTNTTDRRGR
jgi:hypothetical protein